MIIGVGIGPLLFVYHVYSTNKFISESETPRPVSGSIEDVQEIMSEKFGGIARFLKKMGSTLDFITALAKGEEERINEANNALKDKEAIREKVRNNEQFKQRMEFAEQIGEMNEQQLKAALEQFGKQEATIDKNKNLDVPSKQKMKELVAEIIKRSIGRSSDVSTRTLAALDKKLLENMGDEHKNN